MTLTRLLTLILTVLLSACASLPPPPQPVARGDYAAVQRQLQAYITQQLDQRQVMGLSIALVDDQQLVAAWGHGWADAKAQRPADGHTLYRMASISKLFTSTAAMQLVAQQRLSLDAPIQQTLPWFQLADAQASARITLRQLMTHHSGLPRDTAGGMWLTQPPAPVQDWRAMLRQLAGEMPDAPPGLAMGYSNVALDLVGAAVEAASGQPFEDHLQRAVLAPLGMQQARFSTGTVDDPAMAVGHHQRVAQTEPHLRDVPAGGLVASVSDMARFIAMQFADGRNAQGQAVLPPAQWAEMLRPQNADVPLDLDLRTGLGWQLSTFGMDTVKGGGPVAHHAGATFFFRSQLMVLPEQRLGVLVAANDSNAQTLVNQVAQRALALMLEAKTGIRQSPPEPGFIPSDQPWPDAQRQAVHQACIGDYTTVAGPVAIRAQGNGLQARLGLDGQALEMREGQNGRLGLRYRLLGLLPVALGPLAAFGFSCERLAGRDLLVGTVDGQRLLVGERLPPAPPLPEGAAAWAGRYRQRLAPGELVMTGAVQVELADGRLWVSFNLHPAFGGQRVRTLLWPESPTRARLLGPLVGTGGVIQLQPPAGGEPPIVRFSGSVFDRVAP